jgi:uncharacterized SAM-binding protein YcdF (DUF218 family)
MDTIMQSEIFFFISSIGFTLFGILFLVILIYILSAVSSFSRILKKVEKNIDSIGDTTQEMLEEVRESSIFHFLFKKKRKSKK